MVKYYVNQRTRKIHMVGEHPAPRGQGFTQCGHHRIDALFRCTPDLAKVAPFVMCRRCQLLYWGKEYEYKLDTAEGRWGKRRGLD